MAKIAILIDTSFSMVWRREKRVVHPYTQWAGDRLKDYPMGKLAIDIGKRIADDGRPPHALSTTVDIFAFPEGGGPAPPQQYQSFDEIHAPSGGTPTTGCLEYLIDQGYDKIYAIVDGPSNYPAQGPWPDSVATILVIPRIEDTTIFQTFLTYDPHTAATIIAAFIL